MVEQQRSSWWLQFAALTRKCWKVLLHRKISLAAYVFAPPLAVIVLYILFSTVALDDSDLKNDDRLQSVPDGLTRCVVVDARGNRMELKSFSAPNSSQSLQHCITIGFVSDAGNNAKVVMQQVANSVGLEYGVDVVEFPSNQRMSEFMWKNPGHVDLAVSFFPDNFHAYDVWMNRSYTRAYGFGALKKLDPFLKSQGLSGRLLTLQKSLDTAIISTSSRGQQRFSLQVGAFTDIRSDEKISRESNVGAGQETGCDEPTYRVRTQVVIGFMGGTLIATGVGISTIVVIMILASEKQKRLIGKLRQMGLQESAHIASWTIAFLLLSFVSSLLTVIIMKLVSGSHQLFAFKYTSFGVLFVTLYAFQIAMIGVALIVAALFTKPVWIMTVSSLIFLGILFSTMTMNLTSLTMGMFGVDVSGNCVRMDNPYSGFWAPHKATHFMEFVIFWFPWISYGRIVLEMYATTIYGRKSFSFHDLQSTMHYLKSGSEVATVYSAPSLLASVFLMLGLWIVSVPLAWYLSQALAGRTNGRRSWRFPFQRGYWGYTAAAGSYTRGDTFAEERQKSQQENSLRILKMSKSYKRGTALREVSVTMNNGEVFVLLGHNGAGKSTLINVLTGLTDATYGEAYFRGYSFSTDMAQIQAVCGICPQFDALWDELNAEEHLYVCAAMQGLHGKYAAEEIKRVLAAVDLSEEGKNMTTTFSGGMKRRLSVCMSVLGDRRKLIFLDEPTTGVDTINKKRIWELIEKVKEEKIVVLTTHNMEEADALGDKIAILHQGTLKAVGSSLFLKKEFGSGYQISLLLASPEDAPEVEAIVKRVLPGSKIVQSAAGNLKVSLNHNTALAIPKLLTELRVRLPGREKSEPPTSSKYLKEWGISNTTLEEVFLRLSARNDHQVTEENENESPDVEKLCLMCGVKRADVVTLYTRSGISVKVPNAVCLTCALAEQAPAMMDSIAEDENHESQPLNESYEELTESFGPPPNTQVRGENHVNNGENQNDPAPTTVTSNAGLFRSQIRAVLYKNFQLNLAQKKAFAFYFLTFVVYVLLMKLFGGSISGTRQSFSENVCPGRSDLVDSGYCSAQNFEAGFFHIDLSWTALSSALAPMLLNSTLDPSSRVAVTPVVWYSSQGDLDLNYTFTGSNKSTVVALKQIQNPDPNALFVSGQQDLQRKSVRVRVPFCSSNARASDGDRVYIEDLSTATATYDALFPTSGLAWSTYSSGGSSDRHVAATVRYKSRFHSYDATRIWIRMRNVTSGLCGFSGSSSTYKDLAQLYTDPSSTSSYMVASVAPFLAMNAISNGLASTADSNAPAITARLRVYPDLEFAGNRQDDGVYNPATLLFAIMGLSTFFPLYVRRLVMERQTGLLHLMVIAGMKPSAYWLGNYLYDFILSVIDGVVFFVIGRLVGSSFVHADPLMSALIILAWAHALNGMSTFTAGFFSSVRAASLVAIGIIITAAGCVFVNVKYKDQSSMPAAAAIFPPLALARILYLLFAGVRQGELITDIVVLLLGSTLLYVAGVLVNQARASLNPFGCFSRLFTRENNFLDEEAKQDGTSDSEDIAMEVDKVRNAQPGVLAIKTQNLRKIYPASSGKGAKVAVDNLTLGLQYGEIFGLLGANGAGKTTALSMLSGSLAPSAGTIEIGGKVITGKNELSPNQLSICPQSDVVWKDLSVWSHFMIYAYIKGLSSAQARASIQTIAAELSLNGDSFHKKASSLSGGQLRRLSFGVSLVGSPSILLMDEITTGLDPVSRTTIWDVVNKQSNAGRLILLTTHSMEEADTLCTRIGIMAHGKMKCLGAPLHLKNRYSNGYTLTVVMQKDDHESSETIASLIKRAAPDATLVYSWRRVRKFSIKIFDLKYLFQLLEDDANKLEHGIREWQIEQTTLQDVFLKVSEHE
ncbi:uncharacterized protein LOC9658049 [Selaginella moellendorffii]|uniref:uncharacterized protein LOC9658049 n=1 Tax=Selaginella moellendorffii TaxID=88036 RepID=UPI000D1C7AF3|nr:uncharacterized protein LOC9658049 [Selaginella moellendorffii]|eukprot:XP_024534916.1 uncharacterized protein LOC9658049 [Selaginella moellendorffii]